MDAGAFGVDGGASKNSKYLDNLTEIMDAEVSQKYNHKVT